MFADIRLLRGLQSTTRRPWAGWEPLPAPRDKPVESRSRSRGLTRAGPRVEAHGRQKLAFSKDGFPSRSPVRQSHGCVAGLGLIGDRLFQPSLLNMDVTAAGWTTRARLIYFHGAIACFIYGPRSTKAVVWRTRSVKAACPSAVPFNVELGGPSLQVTGFSLRGHTI
jgi:hypothetical protein